MASRKRGLQAESESRSTLEPRRSSRSSFSPMKRLKSGGVANSTNKSQSLPGVASPLALDPKTHACRTPWRRMSSARHSIPAHGWGAAEGGWEEGGKGDTVGGRSEGVSLILIRKPMPAGPRRAPRSPFRSTVQPSTNHLGR